MEITDLGKGWVMLGGNHHAEGLPGAILTERPFLNRSSVRKLDNILRTEAPWGWMRESSAGQAGYQGSIPRVAAVMRLPVGCFPSHPNSTTLRAPKKPGGTLL